MFFLVSVWSCCPLQRTNMSIGKFCWFFLLLLLLCYEVGSWLIGNPTTFFFLCKEKIDFELHFCFWQICCVIWSAHEVIPTLSDTENFIQGMPRIHTHHRGARICRYLQKPITRATISKSFVSAYYMSGKEHSRVHHKSNIGIRSQNL